MTGLPNFFVISALIVGNWFAEGTTVLTTSDLSIAVDGSGKGAEAIDSEVFDKIPFMTSLNLADNRLTEVPDFDLTKFERLTYLNLSGNRLSCMENAFEGLSGLRILDISNNSDFTILDNNCFVGLTSGCSIRLGRQSHIERIRCDVFGGDTSAANRSVENSSVGNDDREKSGFERIESGRTVEMRACMKNGGLEKLYVGNADQVPSENSTCRNVTYDEGSIIIDDKIKQFHEGWCCAGIPDVKKFFQSEADIWGFISVHLSWTEIERIAKDTFENVTGFEYLRINSNRFNDTKIISNLSSTLKYLDVASNLITAIRKDSFSHLGELLNLSLVDNRIETIESGAFARNNKLRFLWLSANRISKLRKGAFTGLDSLLEFHLDSNRLKTITVGVFVFPRLKRLFLTANNITNIKPGAFVHLNNLKLLKLSQNPIRRLKNGAFFGLPKTAKCSVKVSYTSIDIVEGGLFDKKV